MPSEELLKKKTHLKSLEDFLASSAYTGFTVAIEEEIRQLEYVILDTFPTDLEGLFKQCGFRGQVECLATMLERFPLAAEELRDRISELEDTEQKGGSG